ncbi:hypothetical protein ACWGI8_07895 [Streptomyces sp. NPDC054841]
MNPHRKIRSSPGQPALSRQAQGGLSVAALVLIPLLAIGGSDDFRAALDFTTGVLSLLSLTASVAWGLMATDRLILSTRHRLLAQAIHRTTAVASLGFLLLHATVKVSLGHVELLGALVPFGLGVTGTSGLIGLGSLAGLLMVIAASTGAARSALAGKSNIAGRWRALHMLAYPAWCSALMHGLYTGRPAATWVVVMYCLSLTGVAAAVSIRLLPPPAKRRIVGRLLALTGSAGEPPAAPEQGVRNLSTAPLPGASGIPSQPQPRFEREFQRRPADRDEPVGRPIGQPLGSPLGSPMGQPLGPSRGEPRRLAAPAPPLYDATQLYEATPPPAAEPAAAAGSFPDAGPVPSGPLPGDGPGTGISAAYRAVSLAGDASARTAGSGTPPGASSDGIPLAERVPMTEELPIVSDSAPRSGLWPAPSPPPPAQAIPSQPLSSPYDTSATSPYDTSATSPYDTSTTSPYSTTYDQGSAYSSGGGYDGWTPDTPRPGSLDDTQSSPGPLYPPPAGEPWNTPAGDRP